MTQGTKSRIDIKNVSKIYKTGSGTVEAVKNFTESVKDGEFVCVVGASGCGKTTLLWCLSGLHPSTSGTVEIDGEILNAPMPGKIGMVFQDSNLLPWRTLMENIELPFQIKKKPINHELVEELLEVAGLKGFENSYPGELSGGMKQRGSIVRALAQDPEVFSAHLMHLLVKR
ncbi:MAG: ATP-binding cassette domain-containing protein [Actinobacteria bacterium]|nr:ATP-binding cassette domain-containing protein [Actinomycetota bacterium]